MPRLRAHVRSQRTRWICLGVLMSVGVVALAIVAMAGASPPDPNGDHTETICHATGSSSNPFVVVTADVSATGLKGGHQNHSGDIIPPFTYIDHDGDTHSYPGKNLGTSYDGATGAQVLANGCVVPTDVCPNLDGLQTSVPEGMIKNEDGLCVTPPPPDQCPNIEGLQEEVPAGLIKNEDGQCVEPPPVDQCPNIDGLQTSVPEGMIKNEDGQCVTPPPPVDQCPNIEGTQTAVPEGLVKNTAGNCVTPVLGDACPNIEGIQTTVPSGMTVDSAGFCITPVIASETTSPATTPPAGGTTTPPATTPTAGESQPPAETPEATTPTTTAGETTPATTQKKTEAKTTAGELPFTGLREEAIALIGLASILIGSGLHVAGRASARKTA